MEVLSIVEHSKHTKRTVDPHCLLPIGGVDEQSLIIRNIQRVGRPIAGIAMGDLFPDRCGGFDNRFLRGGFVGRKSRPGEDQQSGSDVACDRYCVTSENSSSLIYLLIYLT
jgi:hypothetical protein